MADVVLIGEDEYISDTTNTPGDNNGGKADWGGYRLVTHMQNTTRNLIVLKPTVMHCTLDWDHSLGQKYGRSLQFSKVLTARHQVKPN